MGLTTDKIETTSGANSFFTDEDGNLVVGSIAQTFTKNAEADFESHGANVEWANGRWGNKYAAAADPFNNGNWQTDGSTPYTVASSGNTDTGNTCYAWKAFNDPLGNKAGGTNNYWQTYAGGPAYATISNIGTKRFVAVKYEAVSYVPTSFDVEGYTGSAWVTLLQVRSSQVGDKIAFTAHGEYQSYRIVANNTGTYQRFNAIFLYEGTAATTDNTITTEDFVNGTSLSFDMSAALLKSLSDAGQDVTTDCAIEYSMDNKATWSDPLTVAELKAIPADVFTSCEHFHLRFTLTGSQTLGYVRMSSVASTIKMGTDATFEIKLAGGVTFNVSALGAVLASGEMAADAFKGGQVTVDHADSPYDLDTNYTTVLIDATDTVTVNLPTAVGKKGRRYTFKEIAGSATITIDAAGDETIEGQATLTVTTVNTIESDGANWWIVG
jgi:hypothetical protein